MSRKERSGKKVSTSPIVEFGSNPFASLDGSGLPEALPEQIYQIKVSVKEDESNLGKGERLEIRREKSGRGGKTVTTVCGFPKHISNGDLKRILKEFKSRLGTGGGWRNEQMEIQGDRRKEVVDWLSTLGFKPVLAGG